MTQKSQNTDDVKQKFASAITKQKTVTPEPKKVKQETKTKQVNPTVLLKGLVLNPWSPSTALLQVDLKVTDLFSNDEYMAWKEGLEDVLNELDHRYAIREKSLKGRRVEASYKTVATATGKTRSRVVTIQPYPSRFASAIGYIRTKFYGSPNKTGVIEKFSQVIQEDRRGKMVLQTRLVPESMYPEMVEAMKELDNDIVKLQEDINKYESTEDFKRVKEYIQRRVDPARWSKNPNRLHVELHPIHLNPMPMVASREFIETFTDEDTKKQIKDSLTKVVIQSVKSSQKEIGGIIGNLTMLLNEKVTDNDVNKAQKNVDRLEKMITETNTYQFIGPKFKAVQALLDAIKQGDTESTNIAVNQAADFFNVNSSGGTRTTLSAIADSLTSDIDVKIKSMINASLNIE